MVQDGVPPQRLPWSVMEGWDLHGSSPCPTGCPGLREETHGPTCLPGPEGWWAGAAGITPSMSDCFSWRVQSLALVDNTLAC